VADAPSLACELRDVANTVRRIGDGFRSDPESIALAKDNAARRFIDLARRLERAR
jgi:hypothetical protein